MNILALDLATRTGWALYENGRIESGIQDFSKQRGESNGMLFLKFNRWLQYAMLGELIRPRVDLIVFEQAHHRGGAATEIAVGLMTRVLEFCALHKIEHAPVHSMTLKKWATGSGKADKQAMVQIATTRKWGFNGVPVGTPPMDDNEADAFLLLGYALENYGEGNACNARPATAAAVKSMEQSNVEP